MKKSPFTLIEILITITIITVLTGMLIGGVKHATAKASEAQTKAIMETLTDALEQYRQAKGYYPPCSNTEDVKVVIHNNHFQLQLGSHYFVFEKSNGKPFFEFQATSTAQNLEDSWGNALKYRCPGSHNSAGFDLWSYGPDGKTGDNHDDDNLTNWDKN